MKKCYKIGCVLIAMLCFAILLTGCSSREFEYTGDYPELWSAAVSSIPGQYGHGTSGRPRGNQPSVRVLDRDNFGRVLFQYREFNPDFFNGAFGVIVQKTGEGYVYFYPSYNFISTETFSESQVRLADGDISLGWVYSDEDMERLKEANNWNQELSDISEFDRVRVVRHRERGPLSDAQFIEADRAFFPTATLGRTPNLATTFFLRTDAYGRSIYFRGLVGYDPSIVLFQPDFSFDIETSLFKITDLNNYQTELRLFMEANGWGTPFEN